TDTRTLVRVIDPPFSLLICFSVLRAVDTGQGKLQPGATHRALLRYRKAKEKDDRHKFKKSHGAPQFLSFFFLHTPRMVCPGRRIKARWFASVRSVSAASALFAFLAPGSRSPSLVRHGSFHLSPRLFTSTVTRIQGWMQHSKRCLP